MKNIKSPYMSIIGWGMFLTGALMFASCADDDIIESTAVTTSDAICFSASKTRSMWEPDQTRSASSKEKQTLHCEAADGDFSVDVTVEDGIRSYESSQQVHSRGTQISEVGGWSYKVGAYYFFNESVQDESGTSIDFFSENSSGGLKINTDNNKNNAAVTTPYYWPPVGEMKFFAVAPAEVAEATEATFKIPALANVNTPTLTYTIPSNVAEQKDIMVAQSTVACQKSNTAVDLQFEHLLAAVQFKMGDMIATQVNSITISGIKGGAVTFGYSDGKWTPTSYGDTKVYALTLGTQDQEGNWEAGKLANTLNLDDEADITGNKNNSMLLIAPQTLSGAEVTVNYTEILVRDEEKGTDTKTTAKTIKLPTLNLEAGKTYALTLNISTGLSIEIPQPNDQDAHFVMVNLSYDLSKIPSSVTDLKVSVTDFEYEGGDEVKKSTNEDAYVIRYDQRSETHKRGYWAKKDVITEYVYSSTGELTNTPTSTDVILLDDSKKSLSLGRENAGLESANSIMLFLGENNSEYNRDIILRITGKYNDKTITVGSGRFTQLCPSWNGKQYGCERIEEDESYPFGFYWNKKRTYKLVSFPIIEQLLGALSNATFSQIIGVDIQNLEAGTYGNSETDFLSYTIKNEKYDGLFVKWDYNYVTSLTFNYGALSKLEEVTNDSNGLNNTIALHEHVGGINIKDMEEDLDNLVSNYTFWGVKFINSDSSDGSKVIDEEYASTIALQCNEVIGKIAIHKVSSGDPIYNYSFTLDEDKTYWYLPSSSEAKNLSDPVYKLNGVYWTSTAGNDPDATIEAQKYGYASSVMYENNNLVSTYGNGGVLTTDARNVEHKVRAVRKKP